MKRRISFIFALTVSFLVIFSSIAKAEEIKVPVLVSTLEPIQLEAVKAPAVKTNKADYLLPQAKVSTQVLEQKKQVDDGVRIQSCTFMCSDGRPGYIKNQLCTPCVGNVTQ